MKFAFVSSTIKSVLKTILKSQTIVLNCFILFVSLWWLLWHFIGTISEIIDKHPLDIFLSILSTLIIPVCMPMALITINNLRQSRHQDLENLEKSGMKVVAHVVKVTQTLKSYSYRGLMTYEFKINSVAYRHNEIINTSRYLHLILGNPFVIVTYLTENPDISIITNRLEREKLAVRYWLYFIYTVVNFFFVLDIINFVSVLQTRN